METLADAPIVGTDTEVAKNSQTIVNYLKDKDGLPPAIMVDLDGTLIDDSERLVQLRYGWENYYGNVDETEPDLELLIALQQYHDVGYTIFFVTGRPESMRAETEAWINERVFRTPSSNIYMREENELISEKDLKVSFAKSISQSHCIRQAFDCRDEVITALRAMAIKAVPMRSRHYPEFVPLTKAAADLPSQYIIRARVDEEGYKTFGSEWKFVRQKLISCFNRKVNHRRPSFAVNGKMYFFSKALLTIHVTHKEQNRYEGELSSISPRAPGRDDSYVTKEKKKKKFLRYWFYADVWRPIQDGDYHVMDLSGKQIEHVRYENGKWDRAISQFISRSEYVEVNPTFTEYFPTDEENPADEIANRVDTILKLQRNMKRNAILFLQISMDNKDSRHQVVKDLLQVQFMEGTDDEGKKNSNQRFYYMLKRMIELGIVKPRRKNSKYVELSNFGVGVAEVVLKRAKQTE
jgi:hypothetical protein